MTTSSQTPAVAFRGVTVSHGKRCILGPFSLEIPKGSLSVILGSNGAGKSTLLRVTTGEQRPREGEVTVLDQSLDKLGWREAAALRKRVGVMPQLPEHAPAAPLSVGEVVEIARTARQPAAQRLPEADKEVCRKWLARFGLAGMENRPFHTLSGGEQRRTHLARVFAQEPELILLDEPAGHLDIPSQDELVRVVSEVWEETGATILLITHDLRQVPSNCTHVILLRQGRLLAVGSPDAMLTDELLSELYGEDVQVLKHAGRYLAVGSGQRSVKHG